MSPRPPVSRRTTSPAATAKTPAARPAVSMTPTAPPVTKLKKDEFSTGKARALRAKTLGTTASVSAAAAVTNETGGGTQPRPVASFDTATYLSIVGNPPTFRMTQQQADTLRQQGMQHGVIGMPQPSSPTFAAESTALKQELQLLNANGIHTDTYAYLHWTQSGVARTDAQVRDQVFKTLDTLKGQPVKTFWMDVEFDAKLNPSAGVANNQRILDTAYQAFNDWKAANPDSKLEFGIYTGQGGWDQMVKGPSDPYNTKFADKGVPLWDAYYPQSYDGKNITSTGLTDMQSNLTPFGGWSMDKGNIRGWQYRAGEHDGHLPAFNVGIDRNVWLQDPNEPAPPVTAFPSGFRPDLPITNKALYDLIKGDQGKPVDQRKFNTLQDLINANGHNGVTFKSLGISETACYQNRWEDPWKLVHGLPLGTDQFSTQPLPPVSTTPTPVTPAPVTPTPVTPAPVTPTPVTPAPLSGSPLDLLNAKRGMTDAPRIQQLQDTLMSLGFLADMKSNAGYGKSFGPVTEAALMSFQKSKQLAQTGVVDRATVMALASATHTSLGFDTNSPFAPAFGLARGANAVGDRPGLKALQDVLINAGYAPESMKAAGGYGTNFGPLTEAGLKSFQSENGLNPTGVVDAATVTALGSPRARPAGFAAGLAVSQREKLGLPRGAAYTAADGSLRQDFDLGSVWVSTDHVLHAQAQTPAGLQEIVPPRKLGTAQSLEEARASFVTQWGPTAYNDPPGATDVPYGYEDCGPTSSVMVLSQLGMIPHPSAADASKAIDHMRDLMLGYDSTASKGLSLLPAVKGTVGYGLQAAGAQVTGLHANLTELNAALDRGNPVILGTSTTWSAWGQGERTAGNYLNNSNPGGHFVVLMGRAANGNYLVGDPLGKGGPIEVTQAQVQTALSGAFNSADSMAEISRPG